MARCEVFAATAEQWAATQPKIVWSEPLAAAKQPSWPHELHVAGNQLQTPDGKPVWLQGLCVDSLQWSAAGEHLQQSIPVAIEQWKANVIRLPVNEQFWFGRGKGQKAGEGGLAYRKTVDAAIEAAASRGAYVALDLHRFGAPMPEHADFWKDAATRYKNHPAVLFELFNEPHGISWKLWRDGGNLDGPGQPAQGREPGRERGRTDRRDLARHARTAGRRAPHRREATSSSPAAWTGATTSPAWSAATPCRSGPAATASCIRRTSIPGRAIGSGTPWTRPRSIPVFVGEVGCPASYKGFEFIPPAGRHPLEGWPQDMLATIQKHKLNWTGFSFHPTCGPERDLRLELHAHAVLGRVREGSPVGQAVRVEEDALRRSSSPHSKGPGEKLRPTW